MRGLLAALLVPVALAGTCADSATLDYPAGLTGLERGSFAPPSEELDGGGLADVQAIAAEAFDNGAAWDGTLITTNVVGHGHGTDNGDGTWTYNVQSDVTPPGLDRTDIAGSASGNGIGISATPGFCADDPGIADFYRDNFFYSTSLSICASIMNCGGPAGYRLCYCSVVTP